MTQDKLCLTTFNMRIEKDLLKFLKMQAIYMDCSMTDLANKLFSEYKSKIEKRKAASYLRDQENNE